MSQEQTLIPLDHIKEKLARLHFQWTLRKLLQMMFQICDDTSELVTGPKYDRLKGDRYFSS